MKKRYHCILLVGRHPFVNTMACEATDRDDALAQAVNHFAPTVNYLHFKHGWQRRDFAYVCVEIENNLVANV